MEHKWNFPDNQNGIVNGIAEAGIETFNGSPIQSLAKETCQNSLDARKDNSKPVRVVFSLSEIETCKIPDSANLRNAINSCYNFGTKNNEVKTIQFFKRAKEVIDNDFIKVLRISDFNTTGLTGSDEEYGSPWISLVKGVGVSNKSGEAGGSFGIGKSAPFSCSQIRTVFYSTFDENSLKASQGISRLISYPLSAGGFTTGIGYCGNPIKNDPIQSVISFENNYERSNQIGSDIYILGFNEEKNWKKDLIESILDEFLISIYNNNLEVIVDDILINKKNLSELITQYSESPGKAFNYYQVLTSNENISEEIPFNFSYKGKSIKGSLEFYLLLNNNMHRRVLMCRSNGMKIFDNKGYKSGLEFSGICILKGKDLTTEFKLMENPQHNAWEIKRHNDPSFAEKLKRALNKSIKDRINEAFKDTLVDEVDAEGIGKYLPAIDLTSINSSNNVPKTDINSKKVILELKKATNLESNEYKYEKEEFINSEEDSNLGSKDFGTDRKLNSRTNSSFGTNLNDNEGRNPNEYNNWPIQEDKLSKNEITSIPIRLMNINNKNSYRLIVSSNIDLSDSYINLSLSGEINHQDTKFKILKVNDQYSKEMIYFSNNKIFLDKLTKNDRKVIDFDIDYFEPCPMDVKLYGNKK